MSVLNRYWWTKVHMFADGPGCSSQEHGFYLGPPPEPRRPPPDSALTFSGIVHCIAFYAPPLSSESEDPDDRLLSDNTNGTVEETYLYGGRSFARFEDAERAFLNGIVWA